VVTHPDADHASGMREVLAGLPVKNLWLHNPWEFAAASRPYFLDKRWTDQGLAQYIRKEYDIISELVDTAEENDIPVMQPFAGMHIGPFRVVSPFQGVYPYFMPQFDRTPDADEEAIKAAGYWIGKPPGSFANFLEKAAAKVQKWICESWENEQLKDGGCTSASNETSVVLYGDFGPGRKVLLTGDAGIWGLTMAKCFAQKNGLALQDFMFVQIPHHGSRRNVGTTRPAKHAKQPKPSNSAVLGSGVVIITMGPAFVSPTVALPSMYIVTNPGAKIPGENKGLSSLPWYSCAPFCATKPNGGIKLLRPPPRSPL